MSHPAKKRPIFIIPSSSPVEKDHFGDENLSFEQDSLDNIASSSFSSANHNHHHPRYHHHQEEFDYGIDENVNLHQQVRSSQYMMTSFQSKHEYYARTTTTTTSTSTVMKEQQNNQPNEPFFCDFGNYSQKRGHGPVSFEIPQQQHGAQKQQFASDYYYAQDYDYNQNNVQEEEEDEEEEKEDHETMQETGGFKLPARLQARLLKRHQQRLENAERSKKPNSSSTPIRPINPMENAPLVRRETFFIKANQKPTVNMVCIFWLFLNIFY